MFHTICHQGNSNSNFLSHHEPLILRQNRLNPTDHNPLPKTFEVDVFGNAEFGGFQEDTYNCACFTYSTVPPWGYRAVPVIKHNISTVEHLI